MAARLGIGTIGLQAGRPDFWKDSTSVETRAICDLREEKVQEYTEKYPDAYATTDWREVVTRPDVDIVFVASPDQLHAEMTTSALRAGKHVLCEKPMALSVDECADMIRTAEETGRKLMVGQVCRFAPGFVKAKELIDEGTIGDLFFVESEYAHDYARIPGVGEWRKTPERHGIVGGGCHAVDLLRWIAGNVQEVFGYSNRKMLTDWPVEDTTIAVLKFEQNDVMGKVFCSIGCKRPYTMRSVFYGSLGTIVCDNLSPQIQVASEALEGQHKWCDIPVGVSSHDKGAEVDALAKAIRDDTPPIPDAREGARTVATCIAAIESSRSGLPVQVRNDF
ncbi:MAG: Gfo/Idh/MocA family oxidoreductase [Lentisphaerae bacterium]|jgi:UDP-N-acetylglucosamine 3-dehydrogenase|nr:Gfo/Idh/MocA family oxidoreductase [Lentisphaerota bacterium]MBT4819265.1 Gfo/Idh/MocA family oxidoreductase [Lentisphaerota bacterium]MBT5612173.1 Gfo/Idh/MocA family oxidoreductase [Lentisphaerota bacterium]MBT7061100.1 Gfo/Idh/MocA family oxidoreductase [Lentisphaerota bacterium]MBT7843429.1 Gfo/Idh/MocA family oxidoreductase [Lentisphaerota bacterium]